MAQDGDGWIVRFRANPAARKLSGPGCRFSWPGCWRRTTRSPACCPRATVGCRDIVEPRLVVAPAPDRSAVDRLTRLPQAGGRHGAGVALRLKTGIVPLKTAEGDQPPGHRLAIRDQVLVSDFDKAAGRQRRAPVVHQPGVMPICLGQVSLARAERADLFKMCKVHRQAGVYRMTAALDDALCGSAKGEIMPRLSRLNGCLSVIRVAPGPIGFATDREIFCRQGR